MDLCQKSNVCFSTHCPGFSRLSCQESIIFTIHSDFGAQEEEICHCVHIFPFYLPWNNRARCHKHSYYYYFLIFSLKLALSLSSFTLIKRLFHQNGIICNYEVIDISSSSLDSSWWFIQPDTSHDVQYEKGHEWIASNVWRQERWKGEGQNLCAALWGDGIVSL